MYENKIKDVSVLLISKVVYCERTGQMFKYLRSQNLKDPVIFSIGNLKEKDIENLPQF